MALLSLFFCFCFCFFLFVPLCLSFAPLCMSMLRRSHLFGVYYFPNWTVRLITFTPPRFVSYLINANERKETASMFMATDAYWWPYLCPPFSLALAVIMTTLLPPLGPIYISLIEAISSFERLCRLFIDAQGHSDHTVLMLQMTAIITLLYIKPNYEPEGSQIHTHMHTDVLYANINDLYLCYTKHLAIWECTRKVTPTYDTTAGLLIWRKLSNKSRCGFSQRQTWWQKTDTLPQN